MSAPAVADPVLRRPPPSRPLTPPAPRPRQRSSWLIAAERLDLALYAAVARTPTPGLDRAMCTLTRSADHGRLWLGVAAALGVARGRPGRRAASAGLASLAATSTVVNVVLKPLGRRPRPDRAGVPLARRVRMPRSGSLPSGHAASAFAFATGAGAVSPADARWLRGLAALVAHSRVHAGVHFPGDVAAGALVGATVARLVRT